jgi:hypothetical protein
MLLGVLELLERKTQETAAEGVKVIQALLEALAVPVSSYSNIQTLEQYLTPAAD